MKAQVKEVYKVDGAKFELYRIRPGKWRLFRIFKDGNVCDFGYYRVKREALEIIQGGPF